MNGEHVIVFSSPACLGHAEWVRCCAPYLEPFLAPAGEDPEAVGRAFLKRVVESTRVEEEEEELDTEGIDLCNCEFSLGYGGKILLNSTRLQVLSDAILVSGHAISAFFS